MDIQLKIKAIKTLFITGGNGFVGQNLLMYFGNKYLFKLHKREDKLNIIQDYVIHLAGVAHDLKNLKSFEEYYNVNTEFTKKVFNSFITSNATVFITLSSVKAVEDELECILTEDFIPNPITHYGKSKLLAEQYILSNSIPNGKRVYILRPCMIHGPGNKGNLNLLYKLISKKIPWPLGAFENRRSFCSINNLTFVIKELIEREEIPSGIYNVADDEPISTNELIDLIAKSLSKKPIVWKISKKIIKKIACLGDKLHLPLNTERLHKLTSSYIVSNAKISAAIGKPLPLSSREGLLKTFNSFNR